MPLKLRNFNDTKILNAWADGIENKLNSIRGTTTVIGGSSPNMSSLAQSQFGDGIVHGDSEHVIDPAYVYIRDEFIGGAGTTIYGPGSLAYNFFGEMNWFQGGQGGLAYQGTGWGGIPNMFGVLYMITNSTTNQNIYIIPGSVYQSATSGNIEAAPLIPMFDYPSWEITWIFGLQRYQMYDSTASPFPTLANTSFYLGLSAWPGFVPSSTFGRPPIFVGLRYDRDNTAPTIADSTFQFEAVVQNPITSGRQNTQGNVYNTPFSPREQVPYKFSMRCLTMGQVQMRLLSNAGEDTGWQPMNIPSQTWVGGINYGDSNGLVSLVMNGASPPNSVMAGLGTQIYVNGWNGTSSLTRTNARYSPYGLTWASTTDGSASQSSTTFSYYPAVHSYACWGNDSESSPNNNRVLLLDFFAFLWNPGVNPANTFKANPSLARYF